MKEQLHKRMSDEVVKFILEQYLLKKLSLKKSLEHLKIKKTRFFDLLKKYQNNPQTFSLKYHKSASNKIEPETEKIIISELKKEQKLIRNKSIPIKKYNYTYIKDQIYKKYKITVSVPTIIDRAKKNNFYITKRVHKKHDKEVLTNYPGELIQHDSSYHLFAPAANKKWYLITSIDDCSRYMLYAKLVERETSWAHIQALESVILKHGAPLRYYVDSHSIFRFVQGRDSFWREHKKITDESNPQFKQVLSDLKIDITYALSPQAKGKIERSYQWLQDRIVRTCARENIKTIKEAQVILDYEVDRYNYKQVHSATKEIPAEKFEKLLKSKKSLFREFKLRKPFTSTKDIFCLRFIRKLDAYYKIKFNNVCFRVKGVPYKKPVEIRISPDIKKGIA